MYIGDLNALKKIPILTREQISHYIWAPFANFNEFIILIREILLYPKGEFANLDFFSSRKPNYLGII